MEISASLAIQMTALERGFLVQNVDNVVLGYHPELFVQIADQIRP